MRRILIVGLVAAGCHKPDPEPEAPATLNTLATATRLAEEGMDRWPDLGLNWIETVWHTGLHRLYAATGDSRWQDTYREWLLDDVDAFEGTDARRFNSSDTMSPASVASTLLIEDSSAAVMPIVDAAHAYLDGDALRTSDGAITHWSQANMVVDDDQIWVDSQFMFGMFLLREFERTGDRSHLDLFVEQYELFSTHCRDPVTDLYWHAWDDGDGVNIPAEDTFWARGNSWVLIAGAEALSLVHAGDPAATALGPLVESHAQALLDVQADDGLWHTVLNDPFSDPDNYTETSGSALIAFGLLRGSETVLDPDVVAASVAATVAGIEDRIDESGGELVLSGTSFGTNPGDYEYYLAVPVANNLLLGIGSAVMLFAEADGLEIP